MLNGIAGLASESLDEESLEDQILDECDAMVRYALASGLRVPAAVVDAVDRAVDARKLGLDSDGIPIGEMRRSVNLQNGAIASLMQAHEELCSLIAPATPRGILLLSRARATGLLNALGPVRLIRQMLIAVIVMLIAFVVLATSSAVTANSGDIFKSSGLNLLINELFFLAAGGLGAAFSGLFTAYRYIANGTYDPKYESSYWLRFILGLIAGVIVPSLIPLGQGSQGGGTLTKPLLALLGGFSASVLYRILDRLVQTVESLAQGDVKQVQAANREADAARRAARDGDDRLGLAVDLLNVRDQAASGAPREVVVESIGDLVRKVAGGGRFAPLGGIAPEPRAQIAPTVAAAAGGAPNGANEPPPEGPQPGGTPQSG